MGDKEGEEGTPLCGPCRDRKVNEENIKWDTRDFRRFVDE